MAELKQKLGDDRVILGLSGGVDSTVAAMLLHRAVGKKNLTCIFVDNGLLRKDEYKTVLENYKRVRTECGRSGIRRFVFRTSGRCHRT